MTTIVYHSGFLAADTRAYSGEALPIGRKCKIVRLDDGSLIGVSTVKPGLSEAFAAMINEALTGEGQGELPADLKLQALRVTTDGEVFFYHDSPHPSGPLDGEYFAIGSGAEYALGALALGADAATAVRVAAKFDPWTNSELTVMRIAPEQEDAVA